MSSSSMSSQMLIPFVLGATALAVGFHLGSQHSIELEITKDLTEAPPTVLAEVIEEEEQKEEDQAIPDGDLAAISAGFMEPCKLVLVVRTDLKLGPGKISTLCGHATLACYKALTNANPKLVRHWERTGQAKIALKATSEKQLLELEALAKRRNLCARSIHDPDGPPGNNAILAIGPAPVPFINEVTGKLRLL